MCRFLKYRSKRTTKTYSRVLFPSALDGQQASVFPGQEIQMGGKILPLDKELHPRGSLNFHKGMYCKPNFYVLKESQIKSIDEYLNKFLL